MIKSHSRRDAPAKTVTMARRFEPYAIYWLEEPLRPDNVAGYAELSRATPLRIAAGEAESERLSYTRLMDEGRIVESGSHDELMKRKGPYARLTEHQKLARFISEEGD